MDKILTMDVFKNIRARVFMISMAVTFTMVMLSRLGVRVDIRSLCSLKLVSKLCTAQTVTPMPDKIDPIDKLIPALQKNIRTFSLYRQSSLIPSAQALADFDGARSYGVIDFDTGEVLLEKNFSTKLPVASLTKLMSAVVALDLASPNDQFPVTYSATQVIPTRFVLNPGEKFTLEELLNGALLTSANDCVETIRDGIDAKYGEGMFVKAMNAKATLLGLKNTRFKNPQGYDSFGHLSSAEDMAVLAHFALKAYPLIDEIVQKDYEFVDATDQHQALYMNNWNGLINVYPGTFGVKIGNTDDAQHTTIVGSQRDGHKLLGVVLGAPDIIKRDLWAAGLLDAGFEMKGLPGVNLSEADVRARYRTWKY